MISFSRKRRVRGRIRVRVAAGLLWVTALTGFSQIVINEIHYDPPDKTKREEFIELFNPSVMSVDLGGWSLADGVQYTFLPGMVVQSGKFIVVAENPAAFKARYGFEAFGPWEGKLSNSGEEIRLRDSQGNLIDEVDYGVGFPWPTASHGAGASMELLNSSLDNDLAGSWRASAVPAGTPGAPNSVFVVHSSDAPPQIRQVAHEPRQPASGATVSITAKVSDRGGVGSVVLTYQLVQPGKYIRRTDPGYATNWTTIQMVDDGSQGDQLAGDSIYTAQIPGSVNTHRSLVRYRVRAANVSGRSVTVPYPDDESPNFAYFVYDGVPGWRGASRPGRTPVLEFPATLMKSLPVYHLLANETDVARSQWDYAYDSVQMSGTFVYDGEVYDHIRFRNRGEASTYNTGKNKWRVEFNRGRDFKARDFWGRPYKEGWKTLNLNACASPWAAVNRGMAGLDEGVSFRLYELAGVPSSRTHYVHFRVIDNSIEASTASQYQGDLWGLYQAIEQPDGAFLDERGLPDGNVYKIEGAGDKKHQGPTDPVDTSDWDGFSLASRQPQNEFWWRTHMDMPSFYSFHAINLLCGNVDLRPGFNHYAYHNPDGHWVIMPWDLDMMFIAETHWPGTVDQNNALQLPGLALEFRNRCREILDLMCSDPNMDGGQIGQLIEEFAQVVNPPYLTLTWADVDECMWNWNPRTAGVNIPEGQVNHKGNFYRTPFKDIRIGGEWLRTLASADHEGFVKFIRDYCTDTDPDGFTPGDGDQRGYGFNYLRLEAADSGIPETPVITYVGPPGFPANGLRFRCNDFKDLQGTNTFASAKWRIAEIYNPSLSNYVAGEPFKYEIQTLWESPEFTNFSNEVLIPVSVVHPGATYRARLQFKDVTGRRSHWSAPVQFVASAADLSAYSTNLVISEILYDPAEPSPDEAVLGYANNDFEFIELKNIGSAALPLKDLQFTKGVDFAFPDSILQPGAYALVVANPEAFRIRYGTNLPVIGAYAPDKLDNKGEELRLDYNGTPVRDFSYGTKNPWPITASGKSIVLIGPDSNPNPEEPANWRDSLNADGNPGGTDALSFSEWKVAHGISDDLADDDADGLNAFEEFATGSDPKEASSSNKPQVLFNSSRKEIELTLTRLRFSDVRYRIESSTDLETWQKAGYRLDSRVDLQGNEILRCSLPMDSSSTGTFLRISIVR